MERGRWRPWASSAGLGVALTVLELVVLQWTVEALPGGRDGWEFWVLVAAFAAPFAALAAFAPRAGGVVGGVLAGLAGLSALIAAGVLWPLPDECGDPGTFCEIPGPGLGVLFVGFAAFWGLLGGAVLRLGLGAWRRRRT